MFFFKLTTLFGTFLKTDAWQRSGACSMSSGEERDKVSSHPLRFVPSVENLGKLHNEPYTQHVFIPDNPVPQTAPGVRNYNGVDNPVLLDVARGTSDDKLVVMMVGLPARGKTHIARSMSIQISIYTRVDMHVDVRVYAHASARRTFTGPHARSRRPLPLSAHPSHARRRLSRYLAFVQSVPVKIFNVGEFRR